MPLDNEDLEKQPTQNDASRLESNKDLNRQPTRNEQFNPDWEPFRDNYALQLNDDEVDGALWFMNPTRAIFTYLGSVQLIWDGQGSEQFISQQDRTSADHSSSTADIEYKWTARDNRKGRHALIVHQSEHYDESASVPNDYSVLKGIWRMATVFAFWDISYLTAVLFTLAVTVLLVNSTLSLIPYTTAKWRSTSDIAVIQGTLTVIGCVLFLLSSFLSFVEAVNQNRRGCFGWKREHVSFHDATNTTIEHAGATRIVPDWNCVHRTNNFGNLFTYHKTTSRVEDGDLSTDDLRLKDSGENKDLWRWFPTQRELWRHFIYDLGFVTCSVLLLSSAVYTVAGFGTLAYLARSGNVALWVRILQLFAGFGFTVCSILFTLETQTQWHKPQWRVIGWHISFWNAIGSVGFTVCAACAIATFRPEDAQWAEYQFVLSFMWGSTGFFIGSLLQWYEALDKHPVQMHKMKAWSEK